MVPRVWSVCPSEGPPEHSPPSVALLLARQTASPRTTKHQPPSLPDASTDEQQERTQGSGWDRQSRTRSLHCPSSTWLDQHPSPRHQTADTQISAVPWCCLVLATLSIPVSRQGCTNTSQPAELLELEALSICGAIQRDSGSYTPVGCTEKGLCRDITLPLDLERCSAHWERSRQGRLALTRQLPAKH